MSSFSSPPFLAARDSTELDSTSSSDDDSGNEEWNTAYESTNYDGSDDEAWLAAAMSVMTVENESGDLCKFPSQSFILPSLTIQHTYAPAVVPIDSTSTAPSDLPPSPPSSPADLPPPPPSTSVVPAATSMAFAPNLNRANKIYAVDTPKFHTSGVVNHW